MNSNTKRTRTRQQKPMPQIKVTPVYAPEKLAVARAAIETAWVDALVTEIARGSEQMAS